MLSFVRQLPARDVLDFLSKIRCQDQSLAPETSRASLRLFPRLVPSASSADHQMTPALFARLSRFALPPCSLADWLFALPLVALIPCASHRSGLHRGKDSAEQKEFRRPSDLKHHALPDCGTSYRALSKGRLPSQGASSVGIADAEALKHRIAPG